MISEFNTYLGSVDHEFWSRLCREMGTVRSLRKGEEFIVAGTVAKAIGLVKEGSFKYIVYSTDGQERIVGLETVNGFCASWPYCLRGKPSIVTIVANTDSVIYELSAARIVRLAREMPEVEQQINQSIEEVFYTAYDRLVDLYALSPKERYDKLLAECPALFDIFQLKDIASFLNITPVHLSRLRKQ